jgi:hypothetical protein
VSDYAWFVVKHIFLFALIAAAVYWLRNGWPLFGLLCMSSWNTDEKCKCSESSDAGESK